VARPRTVTHAEDKLQTLFDKADTLTGDDEVLSNWARYLSVLTAGYLETAIRRVATIHVEGKAAPTVQSYFLSDLDQQLLAPNTDKILQFVGSFGTSYYRHMEVFMEGKRRDLINSLAKARNDISHGKDRDVTMGDARRWFEVAQEVVREVERLLRVERDA
jgi:HEPN superfamily RiboL-PSP-like protein